MMKYTSSILAITAVMVGVGVAPVSAAGLLSGILGGNGNDGSVNTGNVADVQGGPAGSDALANVGVGDGGQNNDNVADVNIGQGNGSGTPNANANVSGGLFGNGGLLGTGLGDGGSGVGGNDGLVAGLDLGGLGLGGDSGVTVGIGGTGTDGTGGPGTGGPGTGGTGDTGNPGGPGGPGGFFPGNGGTSSSLSASLGGSASCSIPQGRQVLQTAANTDVSRSAVASWHQAYNVQVVAVRLCPSTREQVARILGQSGKIVTMQNAVASDMLISASLDRSRHDAGDVFAVQQRDGQLTVYVF